MGLKGLLSKIEEKLGFTPPPSDDEKKGKETKKETKPVEEKDGEEKTSKDEVMDTPANKDSIGKDSELSDHHAQEKEQPKVEIVHKEKEKEPIPDSSLETSKKVWKLILKSIDNNYRHNTNAVSGKVLEVCLSTSSKPIYDIYQGLTNDLRIYLSNEGGYDLKEIVFVYGEPENKNDYLSVEKYIVYYCFKDAIKQPDAPQEPVVVEKKALLRAIPGMGMLKKDCYELSSTELQKIKYYNIGRGEDVVVDGFRHNHIAIDENGGDKEKYVSRAHARIGYIEGHGFYLQADIRGCLVSGSRTRIRRQNVSIPIDLENPLRTEILHNNDVIELAKAVYIRFEEIN